MPLLGDENLLTVLLRNLLDNAVRYAPRARGDAADRRGPLEVENEGEPLSGDQVTRLGERFYRPAGSRKAAAAWACRSCGASPRSTDWRWSSRRRRAGAACA